MCHKPSLVLCDDTWKFLPDTLFNWAKSTEKAHLCSIFSPEHGLFGEHEAGELVGSSNLSKWQCPIYSLHGENRAPNAKMLSNIDTLLIDLQEVGVRCFTYLSTLELVLNAAKENNVEVLLLERPNPIKFWGSRGPILETKYESFIGKVYTSFMHGKSIGVLAMDLNKKIGANLTILTCDTLDTLNDYFTSNFVPPSPNLNSINAIYNYPMTVFIEGTNYSEGRGTLYPFQQIGAPWVDADFLASKLNAKKLSGIYFEPVTFTPQVILGRAENPKHNLEKCNGVFFHIIEEKSVQPLTVAQVVLRELFTMYPDKSNWLKSGNRMMVDLLFGSDNLRKWIDSSIIKHKNKPNSWNLSH